MKIWTFHTVIYFVHRDLTMLDRLINIIWQTHSETSLKVNQVKSQSEKPISVY